MASEGEGSLKLHLVHGAKNHFLTLMPSAEDGDDVLTIQHLTDAACQLTGIPQDRQKLIFKGKTLTQGRDPNKSLSSFGLRHGSKVMVLGSKEDQGVNRSGSDSAQNTRTDSPPIPQAEDSDLQKLAVLEQRISAEETTLTTLLQQGQQLTGERGSEPGPLEQLRKGLMSAGEKLMRMLETLDTLRFDPEDSDARSRRKALVNTIQRQMDNCEEMISHIKQALKASRQ